ncbi:ethanolamine ammonia-lyase subunit EutC [Sebaldella sp. S0638]|uniref:ethanolamine ammonia-lyase subunit EutC n=1 Tax=Sebaldella sp. S0638 TaxID=2957809 RepID=UPI00209D9D4D|nr:ethanolamine ammonia-lyase subunit EutC [Sebaldella sp. S0638]MCP1225925.1 ethanolamine ammonia-lyase subunit EutC [Sebaldella sp. S0638]
MLSERELREIIGKVIDEMGSNGQPNIPVAAGNDFKASSSVKENVSDDQLVDLGDINIKDQLLVDNPANREEYMKLKQRTSARLGIGRAGTRFKTDVLLRFRADHAAAQDAVFNDVPESFLEEAGLFEVTTECKDRDEYITRPDLGRKISPEGIKLLEEKCKKSPTVQVYVSDGLSSTAVEANTKNILPAVLNGLKGYGIDTGTPFFVKYGRVAAEDHISDILKPDVVCVLIGERPGLTTAESMSAYIVYKAYVGIPEAKRTVVSNIHKDGTPAAEAGAHVADLIKKILDAKASGQDLKL